MASGLLFMALGCNVATQPSSSELGGVSTRSPIPMVGGAVAGTGARAPSDPDGSSTASGSSSVGGPVPSAQGIAGSPAAAPIAGAASPPAGGAPGLAPPHGDLGKGDGSDVITIGDSWMLLVDGLGIEVSLERFAMNDYRNYAVPGTRIDEIVAQYQDAKREDPEIQTVVMTGGGNDILLDPFRTTDCATLGPMCRAVVEGVRDKIEALWTEMAEDGVQDIFIIGYARPQLDFFQLGRTLEYAAEVTDTGCEQAPVPCTFIDSVEVFGGDEHISFDHIHPDAAGYDLIGEATYEAMVQVGARR